MMRIALFITLLSVSLIGCNSQVKKGRMQKIDSLGIHLNYVHEVLDGIDSQLIQNRIVEINQTSAWVWDNVTDTLDREPGMAFGDYMRTGKYWRQSADRCRMVSKEYRFSVAQLKTLKEDVQHSFYSDEEFKGYFHTESQSIASLVKASDELVEKYQMSTSRHERFKPRVEQIVDSIKSVVLSRELRR